MITQVNICNSALAKVGQAPISSIDQETRAAQTLKSIFSLVQDELLACHPWNFALKRAQLVPNVTVPDFEFDFSYDIPSDCIRVLETETDTTQIGNSWVVEDGKILSNDSTINIRYIYRNVNFSGWSPMFAEVMAWRLAQEIAYALTQSTEREKTCSENLRLSLSQARSIDGAEGVLKGVITDEWTESRQ